MIFFGRSLRARENIIGSDDAIVAQHRVRIRQASVGRGIVRIFAKGLAEVLTCFLIPFGSPFVQIEAAFEIVFVSLGVYDFVAERMVSSCAVSRVSISPAIERATSFCKASTSCKSFS